MRSPFTKTGLTMLAIMIGIAASAQIPARTDSTRSPGGPGRPTTGPRPYREIITDKAKTDDGLFKVHRVDEKYYFEIPDSILGRDILVVGRLSKAPAGVGSYAGDPINQKTIRFDKGPKDKIFLKLISFLETGRDSSEGMYRNVMNSNLQAIAAAFDVKAYSRDSSNSVVEVTEFINGDNDIFFFSSNAKRQFGLSGSPQSDKSYIISVKSYPTNIELKTLKTYTRTPTATPGAPTGFPGAGGAGQPVTFELNTSLVVLPKVPMQARYFDDRIGYFTTQTITDYDLNPQGVDRYRFIARYRLEPKDEDIEKYKKGELVEPKKQIVYYIDPTTPKKWVPYLIAGVNDWQAAFEKAGFKNAIVGKIAPTYEQDSTFSLDDARHSAIVYKASDIPNASGPNINDPRSGEIIESHVNWYHNVMSLLRNWYMVQTAAVDPEARKMEFDDKLMGELIRFVSSHEIGHTLGLRHNFGSSSTVPVENLRNKAWVEANGHTPSIMDYARFNYVAQPEDNIKQTGLFPRIGDYDKWAIDWGYRWFPQAKNADDEVALLNKWAIEKLDGNKRLWWGDGEGNRGDPRSQTEDLGDNAMKASSYGLKNLQRIIVKLPEWTKQANKDYTGLAEMYSQVTGQFGRYIGHVSNNVGGLERTPKRVEQSGPVYEFTPKATQKEAVSWIQSNVFTTPTWVVQKNVTALTNQTPLSVIGGLQERALGGLVNVTTISSLIRFESEDPANAYTATELLNDVRRGVFSELATRKAIDVYRRQLQKSLVERLIGMVKSEPPQTINAAPGITFTISSGFSKTSDGVSIVKAQLKTLAAEIRTALAGYADAASKNHLSDLQDRIKEALEPGK
ncbi:MAG TPA: zinc-dependent metalloprotease [Chitinophagaceae bacterium]